MPISGGGGGGGGLGNVVLTGTAANGKVVEATGANAAQWLYPPGFEIGYDQITAPVNVASTTEGTPTTIIAGSSYTFDGAAVLATFYAPFMENGSAAAASVFVSLWEGATQIGRMAAIVLPSGTLQEALTVTAMLRFTPTAAAHTYAIKAHANSTTGTPVVGAGAGGTGAYLPAFLRLTKV